MRSSVVHGLGNQLPLLTIGAALVAVVWMLTTVSFGVSDGTRQRAAARAALARSLAEELAVTVAVDGSAEFERHGFHATGLRVERDGRADLELAVTDTKGVVRCYRGDVLPGAAPPALGRLLSIVRPDQQVELANDPAWSWLAEPQLPAPYWLNRGLPKIAVPERAVAPERIGIVRDGSIALMRLPTATDQEDFVFAGDAGQPRRPIVPVCGVVLVPGNLWLVDQSGVLTVELSDALTLIVRGNVYVDATLRVLGRGELVVVADGVPGSRFLDEDLDGRYSGGDRVADHGIYAGFLEGSGVVNFGLPGDRGGVPIGFDASLVAHVELVVRRDRVDLHGAVLLGGCLRRVDPYCRVRLTGRRLPDIHRRRIPGFAVRGLPRPGVLEPADGRAFSVLTPSIPGGRR